MRAVVQRVSRAEVLVDGVRAGAIRAGLCVLACAMREDGAADASFIARKIATLRVFTDEAGRMNRSLLDTGGAVLLISQFTLAADTESGTRPSFSGAMEPGPGRQLLDALVAELRAAGIEVEQGVFGARMGLELVNDGPVTILLDSRTRR